MFRNQKAPDSFARFIRECAIGPVRFVGVVPGAVVIRLASFAIATALFTMSGTSYAVDWTKRDQEFQELIQPILKKVCLDCHTGAEADGGLVLSHFQSAKSVLKEKSTWDRVIQRIELGDMPPKDAEPMSDADRKKVTEWLKSTMTDFDCGKTPNPGSVTIRRLNRQEYRNTIRALFKYDYEPAAGFPGDDVGYGFDNIGDVLTLPPLLMEKYLTAAEDISKAVIMAPEPGPSFEAMRKPSQLTANTGGKGDASRFTFSSNGKITFDEVIPWRGNFTLELGMSGTAVQGEYPKLTVSVDEKKVKDIVVQTEAAETPITFTVPLRLKAGKRNFELAFVNDKYIEGKDGKPNQDINLFIYDLKITGQEASKPIPEDLLPKIHKEIVSSVPNNTTSVASAARDVLRKIASRAFRRPVSETELKRLVGLVEKVVDSGDSYEAGLQAALQAILVSPNFLFKVEFPADRLTAEYPLISEYELATRLSYFLWTSTPDQELLSLAAKKQLRDPEVLRKQIDRMIKDDRSKDFVSNFAGQWLTLRKLDDFAPNANMFPQWNDEIKDLARKETYYFFWNVLREDMSVMRLLDADFTYLNEKLARFYGIPGVEGDAFKMVKLTGQPRMGVLTHASVLAVTSNPTRTSPVKRGKWILDNILGTPPPPAPPGVPELEKTELTGTLRQRIEQHRANPACASCHKIMDPLGLALENYDAIGRWRTTDQGSPIDSAGELPGGDKVKNAGDLIRTLRDKSSAKFVRCLTEKLMIYSLGRGLEYYDRCAVDKIQSKIAKDGYRFQSLIYEIVTSDPFQRKGIREDL